MSRAGYISLTSEIEEAYYSVLRSGDRFTLPRLSRKISLMSQRRRRGISQRSLLPACATSWNSMTPEQHEAWNTAGTYTGLTGWRLFVKDQCYRIINELVGTAEPNNYHQALVGQLHLESPASEIKIIQPHPYEYYISQKVVGSKNLYSPVLVTEKLSLPLEIGISYRSNLVAVGEGAFARFYVVVRRLYQGLNIDTPLLIELDLVSDWRTASATLSYILGQYTSYNAYLHIYNCTGDLFFDNIKLLHTSQNWARDKNCDDINQVFTRAFYQVPKHWAALVLPDGAWYESIYPI